MTNKIVHESSLNSLSSHDYSQRILFQSVKNAQRLTLYQSSRNIKPTPTFLIKVPLQNWESENEIYLWRLKPHPHVLGLSKYDVMSHIKPTNDRMLVKVSVEPYICPISEMLEVNLIKCLKMMSEALSGILSLREKFGLKIIKNNNIVIGENGQVKVWLMEKYEINPQKYSHEVSQQVVCSQLIQIFQPFCLSTKLSRQFFQEIKSKCNLTAMMEYIVEFEENQNLFSLMMSKKTMSTNLGSSTTQLQFSSDKKIKKKKKQLLKVQSLPYFEDCSFGDFLITNTQVKRSQEIDEHPQVNNFNSHCLDINPKDKMSLHDPNKYLCTTATHKGGSGFISPSFQLSKKSGLVSSKIKNQSFVMSEIFQDQSEEKEQNKDGQTAKRKISDDFCASANTLHDEWSKRLAFPKNNEKTKIRKDENSIQENSEERREDSFFGSLSQSKRLSQLKEQTFKSQIMEQEESVNPFEIIVRNGWSTDLVQLLNTPVSTKQSITVGKQENHSYNGLTLGKLDRLGKNIMQSFLPVEQEGQY